MSKKKRRIDVSAVPEGLTNNPFADLAGHLPQDLPEHEAGETETKRDVAPPRKLTYRVERTRKGGYDIAFERRAKGKGVTVLRRVRGDGNALLKTLRKKCGAGGTIHEDSIELQGDHCKAVEDMLRGMGL
jgi:translation initiation factor 1